MLHHTTRISFFNCGASEPLSSFLNFTFLTQLFGVIVFMDYKVDTCTKLAQLGLAFACFKSNCFIRKTMFDTSNIHHLHPFCPQLVCSLPFRIALILDVKNALFGRQVAVCVNKRQQI